MNRILKEDIEKICGNSLIEWNRFKNKRILITGATRFNWIDYGTSILFKKRSR